MKIMLLFISAAFNLALFSSADTLNMRLIQAQASQMAHALGINGIQMPPDSQNIRTIGTWPWGPCNATANATINGYNYAIIGTGCALALYNLSDPANPAQVGLIATPGIVTSIAIEGSYAYAATWSAGLCIVNISDPADPVKAGFCPTPGNAYDVAVSGNYAYVANEYAGLRIIDISSPGNPNEVGCYNEQYMGSSSGVAVTGNYVYLVTTWYNGWYWAKMRILDVSNPSQPALVRVLETGVRDDRSNDVKIYGGHCYFSTNSGLYISDISDPTNPQGTGIYHVGSLTSTVAGNCAYVATGANGLRIVDVSDHSMPIEVAVMPGNVANVSAGGGHAFTACGRDGFQTVDVNNPVAPVLIAQVPTADRSLGIAVKDDIAYIANDANGMQIVNISNPGLPVRTGHCQVTGASKVVVAGACAYLVDDSLRIIDIRDPAHPAVMGYYGEQGWDVAVVGNYAYMGGDGLHIIDIRSPTNPVLVGSCSTPVRVNGVSVSGQYVYAAAATAGLRIIDISNPTSPFEIASLSTYFAWDVVVMGRYAYVADAGYGLRIIDVNDPFHPVEVGWYDTPGNVIRLAIDHHYAYIADNNCGLQIVDIHDPLHPTDAGHYRTPEFATDVTIQGSLIFTSIRSAGMGVYQLFNPIMHDIAVVSIDSPAVAVIQPSAFQPAATIANHGFTTEGCFWSYCEITDSSGVVKHRDSMFLASGVPLHPDSALQITFPKPYIPGIEHSLLTVRAALPGDQWQFNDSVRLWYQTFPYQLTGLVSAVDSGGAPVAGAVVWACSGENRYCDTTEISGVYGFPMVAPGSYVVTAHMEGFTPAQTSGVIVSGHTAVTVNLDLGISALTLLPSDSLSATLPVGAVDSSQSVLLTNAGSAELRFSVHWLDAAKGLGDSMWGMMLDSNTISSLCNGVEFDGTTLWLTHSGNSQTTDPNFLVQMATDGTVLHTFQQPPRTSGGPGWQDMAWDGRFLYAGDSAVIAQIDPANGQPTGVFIPSPLNPARALAYNSLKDRFYAASRYSNIYELDRWGTIWNAWGNNKDVYGLAFDAATNCLWTWGKMGMPPLQACQFNVITGTYTGTVFNRYAIQNSAFPGGVGITRSLVPGKMVLLGLIKDTPNRLLACELETYPTWIYITSQQGTIPAGESKNLQVLYNTTSLSPFTDYSANVLISNTSRTTMVTLPVHLHTTGSGVENETYKPISYIFELGQSVPNPFKEISKMGNVSLVVYNVAGQRVKTLFDGCRGPGIYVGIWDGRDEAGRKAAAGVYLCRLMAEEKSVVGRMTLVR